MNEVFADTSGWANYFVQTEPFHKDAKGLMQQWYKDQTRVITTNYILSELVALFISPLRIPRPQQIQAIETIKTVGWIEIIHIDKQLNDKTWQYDDIRKALFELYLRPIKTDPDIDFPKAVTLTQGLSPADIKMITEEAMKLSILDSRPCLSQGDIEAAIHKFIRREKVKNNQMGDR